MKNAYKDAVAAGKYLLERFSELSNNFDENSIMEVADRIREACASPLSAVDPIFFYKYALFFGTGQVSSAKFSFFLTDKWLSLEHEEQIAFMAQILDRGYALYTKRHGPDVPPEVVASRCATEVMTDNNFEAIVGRKGPKCWIFLCVSTLVCATAAVLIRA